MSQQERPVHEIRLGKVKASVWKNDTANGPRFNVTFSRIYKSDKGWESSSSFGRDELPLVSKVADMAHTWIYQQNERSEDGPSASGKSERRATQATT